MWSPHTTLSPSCPPRRLSCPPARRALLCRVCCPLQSDVRPLPLLPLSEALAPHRRPVFLGLLPQRQDTLTPTRRKGVARLKNKKANRPRQRRERFAQPLTRGERGRGRTREGPAAASLGAPRRSPTVSSGSGQRDEEAQPVETRKSLLRATSYLNLWVGWGTG